MNTRHTVGKVFFDTNILVYQHHRKEPKKQKLVQNIIEQHMLGGTAVISTQVVQEFINVALNKFETSIPVNELKLIIEKQLRLLCKHYPSLDFYERALVLYDYNSLNFYDALIIQAALDINCDTLYSEDLQDGQKFGNLTVRNPFA